MDSDQTDQTARDKLLTLLQSGRAILLAGAGSSKFAGYPLWPELVDQMCQQLTPGLSKPNGVDLPSFAGLIRNQLTADARLPEYHQFLERQFTPVASRSHQPFHRALVQLGFSAIVTTNYDIILETAVGEAFSHGSYFRCDAIDLCEPKPYRVLDFLRSIGPTNEHRWVLHLHGWYRSPEWLILTRTDYESRYGEPTGSDGITPRALDTLHRKVIWTLLATHSIVFVGFSMRDDFFIDILKLVNRDFEVFSDPVHFAVFAYESDSEKDHIKRSLKSLGVLPVFYHVSGTTDSQHAGLEQLVFEFGNNLGVKMKSPPITELNKKMLEL